MECPVIGKPIQLQLGGYNRPGQVGAKVLDEGCNYLSIHVSQECRWNFPF